MWAGFRRETTGCRKPQVQYWSVNGRVSLPFPSQSFSCVRLFVTPWTVAHQAPLSMGVSRQEYWNGQPFPSPGHLSHQGWKGEEKWFVGPGVVILSYGKQPAHLTLQGWASKINSLTSLSSFPLVSCRLVAKSCPAL